MTITPVTVGLPAYDLTTRAGCIEAAVSATDNYKQCMLMIVESWCLPVEDGGLGLPYEELAEAIGRKPRTIREYQTELRKQGRLPAAVNNAHKRKRSDSKPSQLTGGHPPATVENAESAQPRAQSVENLEALNMNADQLAAVQEMLAARDERLHHADVAIAELTAQIANLTQTLNDVSQSQQPTELGSPSGLTADEISAGSEHVQSAAPPIDYDWHPGIQMDSEERKDVNRINRLVNEINNIQGKYAFTGRLGPAEWSSILGGLQAVAACADAQRRFKPRAESGPVIDIG